jgi:predicted ferric reductase
VLERAFGQDRLIGLHRVVGLTSFTLMFAHIAAITFGYAGGDVLAASATAWELATDYPGMLLAVVGTALLLMVVITSVRPIRDRLRYESWHLLHLYGYLGVGLVLPHQLWTGQEFLGSTAATLYWWTLWILVAAAVLVWRIGLPLWRSVRHALRVAAVVPEADGVLSVYISGRHLDRLPIVAGQFCNWRFLGRHGWSRANPYSLSAAPHGRHLRISIKSLGDNSARTRTLQPGTRILFEGPYGCGNRERVRPSLNAEDSGTKAWKPPWPRRPGTAQRPTRRAGRSGRIPTLLPVPILRNWPTSIARQRLL